MVSAHLLTWLLNYFAEAALYEASGLTSAFAGRDFNFIIIKTLHRHSFVWSVRWFTLQGCAEIDAKLVFSKFIKQPSRCRINQAEGELWDVGYTDLKTCLQQGSVFTKAANYSTSNMGSAHGTKNVCFSLFWQAKDCDSRSQSFLPPWKFSALSFKLWGLSFELQALIVQRLGYSTCCQGWVKDIRVGSIPIILVERDLTKSTCVWLLLKKQKICFR